jgi:predicted CXXCH cytochrome family protein
MQTSGIDLCLACHKDFRSKMNEGRSHAPAKQDCLTCHKPHYSAVTALLTVPEQPLCAGCHETSTGSFTAAHAGISADVMSCVKCHNPHASKDPKYFKDVMHAPYAARSCVPCHVTGQ